MSGPTRLRRASSFWREGALSLDACSRSQLVGSQMAASVAEQALVERSDLCPVGRRGTAANRPRNAPAASGSSRRSGSRPEARDLIACVRRVVTRAPARPPKSHAVGADGPLDGRSVSDSSGHATAPSGVAVRSSRSRIGAPDAARGRSEFRRRRESDRRGGVLEGMLGGGRH